MIFLGFLLYIRSAAPAIRHDFTIVNVLVEKNITNNIENIVIGFKVDFVLIIIEFHWLLICGVYATRTVLGGRVWETVQDRGTYLQLRDLTIEVPCHHPFVHQLDATHLGHDQTGPLIPAPALPDRAASRCVPRKISFLDLVPARFSFQGILTFLRTGMIA